MPTTTFTDWRQVVDAVSGARNSALALTNFFADEERMREWCADGSFSRISLGGALFFLHDRIDFANVFYFAPDIETLGAAFEMLASSESPHRLVVDVLGPDARRLPVAARIEQAGFGQISELVRMSRMTPAEAAHAADGVAPATPEDLPFVSDALRTHFDPEIDQLPSDAELARWMARGGIRVCRSDGGSLSGFVIYDLLPASLYLKYWFVEPAMRGRGVGSRLMNAMFAFAAHTRRQYFWVKSDNANAIEKYLHYGFAFEQIKDTVLACGKSRKEQK